MGFKKILFKENYKNTMKINKKDALWKILLQKITCYDKPSFVCSKLSQVTPTKSKRYWMVLIKFTTTPRALTPVIMNYG